MTISICIRKHYANLNLLYSYRHQYACSIKETALQCVLLSYQLRYEVLTFKFLQNLSFISLYKLYSINMFLATLSLSDLIILCYDIIFCTLLYVPNVVSLFHSKYSQYGVLINIHLWILGIWLVSFLLPILLLLILDDF